MDFNLSEEQSLLKDSARRYLEKEYDFQRRREVVTSGGGFSAAHWQTFADMGWLGLAVPEDLGGVGMGAVEVALVMEEFGRALVVEPFLPVAILSARTLLASGDRAKQEALLPALAAGASRPVLAHNEAGARGAVGWVETRAVPSGGGRVRLSGRKSLVQGGPFADRFLVSARHAGAPGDERGISLYLVAPDHPGLTTIPVRLADSSRAVELVLNEVELGPEALIGPDGGAYTYLDEAYAFATVALAAEAVGAMDKALWTTRDYLKTRHQFGVPIGSFQALQHRMADMLIELELGRAALYRGLAYLDAPAGVRNHAVSAMKVQIGKSAKFVGAQAIQLHGGIGVTEEYLIGHYFKRLTMIENSLGTSAFHLDRMGSGSQAA